MMAVVGGVDWSETVPRDVAKRGRDSRVMKFAIMRVVRVARGSTSELSWTKGQLEVSMRWRTTAVVCR
jgi:hypothetical protein